MTLVEQGHLVTMLTPQDVAAATSSEVISMENYGHVSFICMKGAGSACTIQVEECTGFGGTGAATKTFYYCAAATAADDVMDAALAAATTAGVATSTSTGSLIAIEIDAAELTDGYQYVRLKCDALGTGLLAWLGILSQPRYGSSITPTAIV